MTAHKHRWKLLDSGRTYRATMRERGGAGNTRYAVVDMPLHWRRCKCGVKEELRNGQWTPFSVPNQKP